MFKSAYKERKLKELHAHSDKTKNLNFLNKANPNNPHPFQSSPIMAPVKLAHPVNTFNQIRKLFLAYFSWFNFIKINF